MATRYNHAFAVSFSIVTDDEKGRNVTPETLKAALLKRVADLDATPGGSEWLEAVGAPYDTYEEEGA